MHASKDLQKAGLKITLPRLKVLNLFEHSENHHLSAEDVFKELLSSGEDVSLATVYRVLTQFETAGLVNRHHFESGQAVFEVNHGHHHDHLVCIKCGKVVEFVDAMIEDRQKQIAREKGFEITEHSLIIYGRCSDPQCRK